MTEMSKADSRARAKEMCRLREEEGMTLQAVADIFGLSRERVRQLVARHKRQFLRQEQFKEGSLRLVVMGDLQGVVPTRVWAAITAAGLQSFPVQTFVDRIDLRELLRFPNLGRRTIRALLETLEQGGYDVSHLWAAGNWENYNTTQYRGTGTGKWGHIQLYSLPSLYAESGAGSQGEGLPEI